MRRVGDADDLEGVQTEPLRFVLRVDVTNAGSGREVGKRAQRGRLQMPPPLEKRADLCVLVVVEEPAKPVIALNRAVNERAQRPRV